MRLRFLPNGNLGKIPRSRKMNTQTVTSIQKLKYWSYISRGRISEVWFNEEGGEWMINEYRT